MANVRADTHNSHTDEGIMGLTPDKGETLASLSHPGTTGQTSGAFQKQKEKCRNIERSTPLVTV